MESFGIGLDFVEISWGCDFALTNFLLTTFISPKILHADSMWSNSLSGSQPITDIPSALPTKQHSPFSLNVMHLTVWPLNGLLPSVREINFCFSKSYKSTVPSFRPAANKNSNGWNVMQVTGDACSWNSMIFFLVRISQMITEPNCHHKFCLTILFESFAHWNV